MPEWLRRILGESNPQAPAAGGSPLGVVSGIEAVAALEVLASQAICHPFGNDGLPGDRPGGHEADASSALARAAGFSLAGLRATAFVRGPSVGDLDAPLRQAVERRLPLVVHAAVDDGTAIRGLLDSGAPVAIAADASQALDLALVLRRVAERALTPAVLILEPATIAYARQPLTLPDQQLIDGYLGEPEQQIDAETPAQKMLFGSRRRRVPLWFDLDRPTSMGMRLPETDARAAELGRRIFFDRALEPAVDAAVAALRQATGRECGPLLTWGRSSARHWLVVEGSGFGLARAVVEGMGREGRSVGVLGVSWYHPSPLRRLLEQLDGAERVTLLDRPTVDRGRTLEGRYAAALEVAGLSCFRATYGRRTAGGIASACRNMLAGDGARPWIHLDLANTARSDFPKKEALLQRVGRDYPELAELGVDPASLELRPEGSLCIEVQARWDPLEREPLRTLIDGLVEALGGHLRSTARPLSRGAWRYRLHLAQQPLEDPGEEVPVDLLLVADPAGGDPLQTPASWRGRRRVVLALPSAASVPGGWQRRFDIFRTPRQESEEETVAELVRAAVEILKPGASAPEPSTFADVDPVPPADESLPLAVRRLGVAGETHDNVARFWNEVQQPRRHGEAGDGWSDPYVALGEVPACTSAFEDAGDRRSNLPSIDPGRCTGCGACWVSCPDSAIGAGLMQVRDWLEAVFVGDGPLRRALGKIASRLERRLAENDARALPPELVREVFDWAVEKLAGAADDGEVRRSADATCEALSHVPLSVVDGKLLLLAVNPRACQGCGICAAVCPDTAIRVGRETVETTAAMVGDWSTWEGLPEAADASATALASDPQLGTLPGDLARRGGLFTVSGGTGPPGSGARIAVRQVAAVVHRRMEQAAQELTARCAELTVRLAEAVRKELARATEVEDQELLQQDAAGLLRRMKESGDFDSARVEHWLELARALDELGTVPRSHFGVVVAGGAATEWASAFPRNPFGVPAHVDLSGHAVQLAHGLAQAAVARHVELSSLMRLAEASLEESAAPAPPRWQDLSTEERADCPPILLLVGSDALDGTLRSDLMQLLQGRLPVKAVVLDDADLTVRRADPVLEAMTRLDAFVLSTSIAHGRHLSDGVAAALGAGGPALIRIHAPSPDRHGFPKDATIARAHAAVQARVQPLLRYDPRVSERFGARIDLDGNPQVERLWARADDGRQQTPLLWASAEGRYQDSDILADALGATTQSVPGPNGVVPALGESADDPTGCTSRWRTLQELAGILAPVTEPAPQTPASEDVEARIGVARSQQRTDDVERLRLRLLELAGYGGGGGR